MLKLREISDMQRLVGRCVYGTAGGKDLRSLANCASALPAIRQILSSFSCTALKEIASMDLLEDILGSIDAAICDNPPFSVREGGIIRTGYSEEIDRLRDIAVNVSDGEFAILYALDDFLNLSGLTGLHEVVTSLYLTGGGQTFTDADPVGHHNTLIAPVIA